VYWGARPSKRARHDGDGRRATQTSLLWATQFLQRWAPVLRLPERGCSLIRISVRLRIRHSDLRQAQRFGRQHATA